MPESPIASLDLGSNTFRLMLAERKGKLWAEKHVYQHIPRLSERLTPGGTFAPEAIIRAREALDDFAGLIEKAGASRVLAGATMAARLAADGPEFIAGLKSRYGWEAQILSGDEEAGLTAAGVLHELSPLPRQSVIFDIGGRSTEFISAEGNRIIKSRSLAMGVVGLTETFARHDPPETEELARLSQEVKRIMTEADFSDIRPGSTLVGTAGTVTTLAAMLLGLKDYAPSLVQGARLGRPAVAALLAESSALTIEKRISRYNLHPRRADAIVAGLAMVLEILAFFHQPELVVSDNGLLEGLWLRAAGIL